MQHTRKLSEDIETKQSLQRISGLLVLGFRRRLSCGIRSVMYILDPNGSVYGSAIRAPLPSANQWIMDQVTRDAVLCPPPPPAYQWMRSILCERMCC